MKSLLTALLSAFLMSAIEAPDVKVPNLEQQLDTELNFEKEVKIFSYEGELIRALSVESVSEGTISVIDYLILEDSDYAFDIYGDYYYFTDKELMSESIN